MEFPFGHHHHRRNEEDENPETNPYPPPGYRGEHEFGAPPPPRPPPPYYQDSEFEAPPPRPPRYFQEPGFAPPLHPQYLQETGFAPPPRPPTQVTHVQHHTSDYPEEFNSADSQVSHVAHEVSEGRADESDEGHHAFRPHLPSFLHQHSHSSAVSDLSKKRAFKVYCKAEPNFCLTIRDGTVVLAPSNASDEFQHWYKDEKYSTRVKDEEGFPCFALVNKASGQAMKHSVGDTHPVQLIPYNPDILDQSILWTESKDLGDGYRTVRMVNNIRLNVDAFHGDKNSGGVHDGTTIVLWQWNKGDNQRWKIVPYCKFLKSPKCRTYKFQLTLPQYLISAFKILVVSQLSKS